jgi:phosphatidylglycerol:prolipoprotein diacylglycerol transferase
MHPILFRIPLLDIPIYSYGVMLGLSLIVAWYMIMYLGSKERLARDLMSNCFLVTAVLALLGARVLYIITNFDDFDSPAQWLNVREGGIVAYGGFLGGLLGSWLYLRPKKVPLMAWADLVAPTLGTGLLFTRVGCYLFGCDFGGRLPGDAPQWLKSLGTFPKWSLDPTGGGCQAGPESGSPAWAHHVANYDLPEEATASFPVHPTQLYESVAGLIIFGIAMIVWRRRGFRGQVILIAAMAYSVWRFLIEYVRDDPGRGGAFALSTSQLISMGLLPVCVLAYVMIRKRFKERGDPAIPESALQKAAAAEPSASAPTPRSSTTGPRRRRKKK